MHPSSLSRGQSHFFLYERVPGVPLGVEENPSLLSPTAQDVRLCFNCGSSNHAVASCSEPIDRQLISLSRLLFNFFHPDSGGREFTRLYVSEGWKQQRLEWLRIFEPGVIRGSLLRDALGLQERDPGSTAEWLRNMACWGYPPGWVGRQDPTELASYRIMHDEAEEQITTTEWNSFTIFDGADNDERINLRLFSPTGFSLALAASSLTASAEEERSRWATYPNTYFSSTALSIYNGSPLDMIDSSSSAVSVTFTAERRALWERVLFCGLATSHILSVPPWRRPGAFGDSSTLTVECMVDSVPPQPSTTPPPLPLLPGSPLPTFTPQECTLPIRSSFRTGGVTDIADDESVIDMDVSEDSE